MSLAKADLAPKLLDPELTNVFPTDADVATVSDSTRDDPVYYWSRLATVYTKPAAAPDGELPLLILATIIEGFQRRAQLYLQHADYVEALRKELADLVKDVLAGRAEIEGLTRLDAADDADSLTGSARFISNTRIFTPTTYRGF